MGDSYRPYGLSRRRSPSHHRTDYDDERYDRQYSRESGPSHNDGRFGFDGGAPSNMRSVTDSVTSDSPRSPFNRDDGRTFPSEKSTDPRLASSKRVSDSVQAKSNNDPSFAANTITRSKIPDRPSNQTVDLNGSSLNKYFGLLAQRATYQAEVDRIHTQLRQKKDSAESLLRAHPELREVHLQMTTAVEQTEVHLQALLKKQEQNQVDLISVLASMSTELKNLLQGVLPDSQISNSPRHLDSQAMCKRLELLEAKDALREREKLEYEKRWSARIETLEKHDRIRAEEVRKLEESIKKLESLEKAPVIYQAPQASTLDNTIEELKILYDDHKLKIAKLSSQFTSATDFRDHLSDYMEYKKRSAVQISALQTKVDTTTATAMSLEDSSEKTAAKVLALTEEVNKVSSDFAELKQLAGQYQAFWNTSSARLDTLEGQTTSLQDLPESCKTIATDLQNHIASNKQQLIQLEGRLNNALSQKAQGTVVTGLQKKTDEFIRSAEQRYRASSEKVHKDIETTHRNSPRKDVCLTPGLTIEEKNELSNLKAEVAKVLENTEKAEHGIRSLTQRYNQISTNALSKQISLSLAPSLMRIPDLEEASRNIAERVTNIEQQGFIVTAEIADLRKRPPAQSEATSVESEALSKITILETRLAGLAQSRNVPGFEEKTAEIETRLYLVEEAQTQLPQLYYAKASGDDIDGRLHGLESLEIKGELESHSNRYSNLKKVCKQLQKAVDQYEEDIASIDEKCEHNTKAIDECKQTGDRCQQTCNERQQELDSKEGEVEMLSNRVLDLDAAMTRLLKRIERKDEEDKADIHTLKENIDRLKANEIAFIDIKNLASLVGTADKVRGNLHPFQVHRVWFEGQRQSDDSTTFHAVAAVNMIDVDDIIQKHNSRKWKGRTVKIELIPDNVMIDKIFADCRPDTVTEGMQRETTVMSTTQRSPDAPQLRGAMSSGKSKNITTSSQKATLSHTKMEGGEDMPESAARQAQQTSVPGRIPDRGTRDAPFVVSDSQGLATDFEDDDDTIEVNTSPHPTRSVDLDNLESWTRPPPFLSTQRQHGSASVRSRSNTGTPTTRKRPGSAGKGSTAKRPRQN